MLTVLLVLLLIAVCGAYAGVRVWQSGWRAGFSHGMARAREILLSGSSEPAWQRRVREERAAGEDDLHMTRHGWWHNLSTLQHECPDCRKVVTVEQAAADPSVLLGYCPGWKFRGDRS